MGRPVVYLCKGSDCRGGPRKALVAELRPVADVRDVRCQSICKGPVAGIEVADRLEWFARVRSGKARRAVAALAVSGGRVALADLRGRLAKRRVPKRAGRLKR